MFDTVFNTPYTTYDEVTPLIQLMTKLPIVKKWVDDGDA